jgi:chromosome condensin MukBEF ATPase and DNA-binding subunit MukB
MRMDQFIADVRNELQDFCGWESAPIDPARLEQLLESSQADLERLNKAINELQSRLFEKDQRAGRLAARVEVFHNLGDQANAWQQALTLDQLRQIVGAEQQELQDHLRNHDFLLARIRRLQGLLADWQSST